MAGLIYLVQPDGSLAGMLEQPYDTEDVLQHLLATYPDLLAGEQVNTVVPRRWLLVSREATVPSEEGGGGRWSVDHLFLDQDGTPTIVEVKRSTDTRIRREVVGQMLDYAANAVVYWPVAELRARFEARCVAEGSDPSERIAEALDIGDADALWQLAQTNLQAGRVRLVFVADVIPVELRRVVEFLNGQMNPAEVLAVEVKQYVGQGQQALVPRVIGQTAQATAQKSTASTRSRETRQWDESSFLTELELQAGAEAVAIAKRTFAWAVNRNLRVVPGSGVTYGSMAPEIDAGRKRTRLFYVETPGRISVDFRHLRSIAAFEGESTRLELIHRLNNILGIQIGEERVAGWTAFPIHALVSPSSIDAFLATFDWVIDEVRRHHVD